ncbi:hypothetical protein [Scatolibacter rhodanostii]|uniref:hypothetical protein n=1 Tax=Scatolibacter rhodanostii TaxID=2014781 RepID=UPI000C06AA53|nr:hypothetical protein [Scatolibacter rhodanostii]
MQESDYIIWWETEKETGLQDIKTTFVNLFSKTAFFPPIYHPILYKYLKNSQLKYWEKEIFLFTQDKIRKLEDKLSKEVMISFLLSKFHLLSNTYQSLLNLEERIMLMNRFKGNEELKAKIFSINIYNDLLNTAFSNILELFIEFESVIDGKNLFQKNLKSKIDCLASSKRGYKKITDLADANIRNAISHGSVKIIGSEMTFSYRIGAEHLQQELTVYEFKDSILQLYDGVSAIVLAWVGYLCEANISYNEIYKNEALHEDTLLFFERLSMSTLLTTCDRVFQIEVNNQNRISVELIGVDLDIDSRIFLGLHTAERIFKLRELSAKDTIMVSFHSPKVLNSFFTVSCEVISNLSNGVINLAEAWESVLACENALMFPINDEDRNEFEDSFRYYPDIEGDGFRITEIEDISTDKQKRFKAVAYLDKATRPNHVKGKVEEIISIIKGIENYGFTSNKVKHGKMSADIIYLVLYKKEVRRGNDRGLYASNNNFIAQIQYDADMSFPIHNRFIDRYLKKRREKTVEYNWNPNFV